MLLVRSFFGKYLLLMLSLQACIGKESTIDDIEEPEEKIFTRLLTKQELSSTILKRSINYAVLLPDGYDSSTESYPVVYLLHGYGDNETAWYQGGSLLYNMDKNEDVAVPMIYVMPQGFNTYYINKYNGTFPYMDMFVEELVPTIDSLFRTKGDKTQRAVMGYSMGGYGALILPALNPDVFSISVPLSMSFRTKEQYLEETQGAFDVQWGPNFGPGIGASGESRFSDYYKDHSPFYFFDTEETHRFDGLKILVDCGDDEESLSKTNNELHVLMRDRGIPHEYRVRSGGHSWTYWKQSYPEALAFISDAVQNLDYPTDPDPVVIDPLIKEDDFDSVNIPNTNIVVNVFLPEEFSSAEAYPVLYFLHDHDTNKKEQNIIDAFSLLRNAMQNDQLQSSIVVEIPAEEVNIPMADIVGYIDQEYSTVNGSEGRLLFGNGRGGSLAIETSSTHPGLITNHFAFNPVFAGEVPTINEEAFYYLDMTDEASGYRVGHELYLNIRLNGKYEYRVRQGQDSYQSFLNGLDQSLKVMKQKLGSG